MRQQTLILTLLLISVLTSSVTALWWLAPQPKHANYKQPPDFYMTGLKETKTNQHGQLVHQLRAPSWQYYNDSNQSYILHPNIIMYNAEQGDWHMRAKLAVSNRQQRILLRHDVQLQQDKGKSTHHGTTIDTSHATIYPQQNYAITDAPVTIHQASNVLHARGARFNYQTQQVDLHSHVHIRYQTQAS